MRWLLTLALFTPAVASAQDADEDGVPDADDNCLGFNNPTQDDSNDDGFGDACVDPTASVQSDLVLGSAASIHARAIVGSGVQIRAGSLVSRRAQLGDGSVLELGVTFGRAASTGTGASLGDSVSYGYGAVAGNDLTVAAFATVGSLVQLGSNVTLGTSAVVARGAVVGDDVTLGAGTVVGPDVTIGTGTDIGANVRVRKGATIEGDVDIADNARIGRDSTIHSGADIGVGVRVGAHAVVASGAIVPDGTVILRGETWGGTPEVCDDNLDNNDNGLVDCEDSACSTECVEICDDGEDNDADSLVDCEDDDCWGIDCHPNGVKSWVTGGTLYLDHFNPTLRYTTYALSNTASCQFGSVQNNVQRQRFEARSIQGQVAVQVDSEIRLCDWSYTLATGAADVDYGEAFDLGARDGFQFASPERCRLDGSSFLPTRFGVDSSQLTWSRTVQTQYGSTNQTNGLWMAGNGNNAWLWNTHHHNTMSTTTTTGTYAGCPALVRTEPHGLKGELYAQHTFGSVYSQTSSGEVTSSYITLPNQYFLAAP